MKSFWKALSRFIFWLKGWQLEGGFPTDLKKAVMIAAPHTSNWDFLYARAAFFLMEVPMKYTIKKEVMVGPLGWLLASLGAIPVDRGSQGMRRHSLVDVMAMEFERREELVILVTPEGTRQYATKWKSGFYRVAQRAQVPMVMGYLDYKRKVAGVGPVIYPTGDYEADLRKIKDFFRDKTAKYPEQGVR
ncbi:MAG: glycerol acyltransferase [Cytophagales bacterium]|nr:glycerol acyltransferase [Cytophagales bacterium]